MKIIFLLCHFHMMTMNSEINMFCQPSPSEAWNYSRTLSYDGAVFHWTGANETGWILQNNADWLAGGIDFWGTYTLVDGGSTTSIGVPPEVTAGKWWRLATNDGNDNPTEPYSLAIFIPAVVQRPAPPAAPVLTGSSDQSGSFSWTWAGQDPVLWVIYKSADGVDGWVAADSQEGNARSDDAGNLEFGSYYKIVGVNGTGQPITAESNVVVFN